jgi:alkanesulfonate monooxygenase SsuD/methylene tetrahydromethanopterin reductase-like flavin-dependent oxidoreductase (luciferase family)
MQVGFPPELQKPVEDVVDAFLYLDPRDVRLFEPIPADIALDTAYMTELQRREALTAFPGTPPRSLEEMRDEILQEARHTILEGPPPPPDVKAIEESCRAQQRESAPR